MSDLSANNSGGGEAVSPELASNAPQGDDIETGLETEGDEPASPTEPETEEVEEGGVKYKIPKALKDAFLRQSDYTKKTQEVADRARAIEERDTAIKNNERVFSEHRQAFIEAQGLDNQVKDFEKVNWQELNQKELAGQLEKGTVQTLWLHYQQAKDARDKSLGTLQQKIAESSRNADAQTSKRREESHAEVARSIKDWNPQTFDKVKEFGAREFGLKPADFSNGETDPRLLRVLHRAFVGTQAMQKLAASEKAKAVEEVAPLPTVGGAKTAKPGLRDDLSMEEWMRRRNTQTNPRKTA